MSTSPLIEEKMRYLIKQGLPIKKMEMMRQNGALPSSASKATASGWLAAEKKEQHRRSGADGYILRSPEPHSTPHRKRVRQAAQT